MNRGSLLRIGEVAKMYHLSVELLRYYDKIGLLKPEIVDSDSGYRYYGVKQLEHLNLIRFARTMDIPLERIAKYFHNPQVENLLDMLNEQQAVLERRKKEILSLQHKLNDKVNQINGVLNNSLGRIRYQKEKACLILPVASGIQERKNLDWGQYIRKMKPLYKQLLTDMANIGIGLSKELIEEESFLCYDQVFLILNSSDERKEYLRGKKEKVHEIPAQKYVSITYLGGNEKAPEYYRQIQQWMKVRRLKATGAAQEIHRGGYDIGKKDELFITEIRVPVE